MYEGDDCGAAQCAEHGAGEHRALLMVGGCACGCPQRAPLFREDRELCVDDLPECSLATFGTGSALQRIPFVFLPLKGQIIHPSREITFHNVKTPICAVSGAQFLTRKGFLDLRNTLDADVPFNLFRDEGRTFLQWNGEDDVRARMSGRLMVVRLLCRDVSTTPASPLDLRGVFTPCVAFRVQGTPPRHATNITEVQFTPDAQIAESSASNGLSATEYVAIGISSLLLGLIYVASVFLYLHIRKRKKIASEECTIQRLKQKKNGKSLTQRDIMRINSECVQSLPNVMGQDDGVIKKNPLLSVVRSFTSDSGSNVSDSEDMPDSSTRSDENGFKKRTTSAVIHLQREDTRNQFYGMEMSHRDESGIEKLPDEHVSIVETIEDREIARPVGTTRRKLYFNPAYFEPHLMADPPVAALEFLSKIREVIAVAKQKMAAKRFHPVLNEIPEETYPSNPNSIDLYHSMRSRRSASLLSLKRNNSRRRSTDCLGCPGCKSENKTDIKNIMKYEIPSCSNCKGDKQNSIRKWLENIPNEHDRIHDDFLSNAHSAHSLSCIPVLNSRSKIQKQNSFSENHLVDFSNKCPVKKTTTRSVRSEPSRTYNIPLPDFGNVTCDDNLNYFHSKQMVESINCIDYRPASSKSNASDRNRQFILRNNNNSLPDMVNDTIALNDFSRSLNQNIDTQEHFTQEMIKEIIQNPYMNNSESPLADYETDSLERNCTKTNTASAEYPEVPSSQASPSLSNALPLEEELTMRNAVYKNNTSSNSNTPSPDMEVSVDQNHYEIVDLKKNTKDCSKNMSVTNYSLVSEVYVNNSYNFGSAPTSPSGSECSMGSKKEYRTRKNDEKPGCLTIEVKDPPENYIRIHESDGFEPDTLDRKHPKHKESFQEIQTFKRKDFLKYLDNQQSESSHSLQLRSSGSFIKNNNGNISQTTKFHSLRNDVDAHRTGHQRAKISTSMFDGSSESKDFESWDDKSWTSEEGRVLTLELRHSKRQRQCTPPTAKQQKHLARPDILPPLPPTEETIYKQPNLPVRRVEIFSNSNNNGITLTTEMPKSNITNEALSSTYEGVIVSRSGEFSKNCNRNSSQRHSTRSCSGIINTNTFVREPTVDPKNKLIKRKAGMSIDDSGYLSSDSTSSRPFQRKLVIAKLASCSDSDDTANEARSESGAESVETHSVYFGSFRNNAGIPVTNDTKNVRISKVKN
ncbi:unnamed protein product [Leptidea sinapis]|uniref:Shavenoid isoform B-like N-terminal domain-containing protein n=1 Tax=Leptidea sinapis TaxID=189913 RepID=A0A5E4QIV3_9NEOP|nr:unnamed protein product [Leptidea sinapis]